jgi:hypothetical protein
MRRVPTMIMRKMMKMRTMMMKIKNDVEDVPEAANQVGSGR